MQGWKYFLAVKTASPVECGDLIIKAAPQRSHNNSRLNNFGGCYPEYFVFEFGIYFCCDRCLWLVNWNSVSQLSQSQAAVAAKVDTKLKHKIFWVASTKIVQSGVVMRSLWRRQWSSSEDQQILVDISHISVLHLFIIITAIKMEDSAARNNIIYCQTCPYQWNSML